MSFSFSFFSVNEMRYNLQYLLYNENLWGLEEEEGRNSLSMVVVVLEPGDFFFFFF